MNIPESCRPYLKGEQWAKGLQIEFEFEKTDWDYVSRFDFLINLCKGKRIIHLGCVDHNVRTIQKKMADNRWLHRHLCDSAEMCYGVDINKDGINYMRDTLGYKDVAAMDILLDDHKTIFENRWDYLLIPEVLEHIENPADFLRRLWLRMNKNVGEIVITVPNAFYRNNWKNARLGFEHINSDHKYWFTPYTLSKVVSISGLFVRKIIMCKNSPVKQGWFRNYYMKKHPLIRQTIILLASSGAQQKGNMTARLSAP